MLTTTRKRARRVAATAAACAAATLLIPAGSAQGASRLSKSAITRIKQNETVLKPELRANPGAPFSVQSPSAPSVVRRRSRTAQATASAGSSFCSAQAGAVFNRNFTLPGDPKAMNVYWANSSACFGPIPTLISSQMIDPSGHNSSQAGGGVGSANIANLQQGPEGTWQFNNAVTWVAPPGFIWPSATGFCTGVWTQVLTCF